MSSSLRETSGKKAESYACETCSIQCASNSRLQQHKLGKRHLAAVKAAEGIGPTAKMAQLVICSSHCSNLTV